MYKIDIYLVMEWKIIIANKAAKQIEKLPKSVKATLLLLLRDIEIHGPAVVGKIMGN